MTGNDVIPDEFDISGHDPKPRVRDRPTLKRRDPTLEIVLPHPNQLIGGRSAEPMLGRQTKLVLPAIAVAIVLTVLIVSGPQNRVETEVGGEVELNNPEPVAEFVPEPAATPIANDPASEPARVEIIRCDVDSEELEVVNSGEQMIDLEGWVVHDDGRVWEGELSDITLDPGERIVLLSGDQTFELEGTYRWTRGNVWNNRGGDVATLINSDGVVVETFEC